MEQQHILGAEIDSWHLGMLAECIFYAEAGCGFFNRLDYRNCIVFLTFFQVIVHGGFTPYGAAVGGGGGWGHGCLANYGGRKHSGPMGYVPAYLDAVDLDAGHAPIHELNQRFQRSWYLVGDKHQLDAFSFETGAYMTPELVG